MREGRFAGGRRCLVWLVLRNVPAVFLAFAAELPRHQRGAADANLLGVDGYSSLLVQPAVAKDPEGSQEFRLDLGFALPAVITDVDADMFFSEDSKGIIVMEPTAQLAIAFPDASQQPCVSPLWDLGDPVCSNARAVTAVLQNFSSTTYWLVPAGEPCEVRCSKGNWIMQPNVQAFPCNSLVFKDTPAEVICQCCRQWVIGLWVLLPAVLFGTPLLIVTWVGRGKSLSKKRYDMDMEVLGALATKCGMLGKDSSAAIGGEVRLRGAAGNPAVGGAG
eukprot:TRINITY_DN61405_c0_g1_i1.p1 TRINITY_DN61405_c0_g1~~TRINITY_DN61405_c0_g1_i1.p1  ORF type:complete len:276 (-),score=50.89 TRINITY_DN61405_c0_g1_i1:74-901(-)